MPVLSRFYGIVVRILFAPLFGARFHAIYGDYELVVAVAPLAIIQGDAPPHVRELVLRWAAGHQQELLTAWRRCGTGLKPQTIAPLF